MSGKKKLPTQEEKILRFMRANKRITQRQATRLGVMRLASRISDMRSEGHKIDREMIEVKNADGTKSRVARYTLIKEREAKK